MPFTMKAFSLMSRLTGIERFSMLKAVHPENVLEHTGMVVLFSYLISNRLNTLLPDTEAAFMDLVDVGSTLRYAAVHDLDESITGDLVRPTKYFSAALRHELSLLEVSGMENLKKHFEMQALVNDHEVSKAGREGSIVALADVMAAVHRVWEEVFVFNNHHFIHPAIKMRSKTLPVVMNKVVDQNWTTEQRAFLTEIHDSLARILDRVQSIKTELVDLHP